MSADRSPETRKRMRREQIHPDITAELRKRLRLYAGGKGASQSSVVQAALTRYVDDANEGTLIIQRLDRLHRGVARLRRDVHVVADTLALFVQVWFAHTPRIPDSDRSRAERVALERFAKFTEHVSARIAAGRSVIGDLVRDRETSDGPATGDSDRKKGDDS